MLISVLGAQSTIHLISSHLGMVHIIIHTSLFGLLFKQNKKMTILKCTTPNRQTF